MLACSFLALLASLFVLLLFAAFLLFGSGLNGLGLGLGHLLVLDGGVGGSLLGGLGLLDNSLKVNFVAVVIILFVVVVGEKVVFVLLLGLNRLFFFVLLVIIFLRVGIGNNLLLGGVSLLGDMDGHLFVIRVILFGVKVDFVRVDLLVVIKGVRVFFDVALVVNGRGLSLVFLGVRLRLLQASLESSLLLLFVSFVADNFFILIGVFLFVVVFFVVFATVEHVVVHVFTLRLEIATQVDLGFAFTNTLGKDLHILSAVDVQVQTSHFVGRGQHCDECLGVFALLGDETHLAARLGFVEHGLGQVKHGEFAALQQFLTL